MSRRERQRRKQRNQAGPSRAIFLTLGLLAACAAIVAIAAVAWVINVANSAPSLDTRKPIELGATSRVYAADGTRLGFISGDIVRLPVPTSEIPENVRNATVAIEDRRFYDHKGVDFEGIIRAGIKNLESKKDIQGGSTLTMQLVRNLYTGERTRSGIAGYKRKIREAKLAQELEDRHPGRAGKLWILNKYVNSVPYGTVGGQTAVGIQAAARVFFDKPASALKLREAALLAGLPQAPSDYNPFLDKGAALARRNDVLQRMADQGYIKQVTADRTKAMALGVKRNRYYAQHREGYFLDYVKQLLVDKYGLSTVRGGGLRVDTTIDLKMQREARNALDGNLGAPDRAGAIVTIDPHTGYIKAMASSSQYGDSKYNLAAQGHRQAGSTFKVMVLMDALRRGVNPSSTSYVSRPLAPGWLPTAPDYEVQTFGHTYGGSMNLVTATLKSDNTVYAQLDADLGPQSVARTARDMGITSPLHGYPAEGLGGLTDGVSPLEMARAYATIANGGWRMKPIAITEVTFPDGHRDNLGKPRRHRAFTDGVTYEATQILEKNVQSGTGTRAQIGCPAAGKTGTVDDFTDAWFVGFTPRLVTSVWVGHPNEPYPLGPNAQGGAIAAPIWGAYMKSAKGKFCGDFPKPKVPFGSQPFFGKYSRSGGKSTHSTNPYGSQVYPGTGAPSPGSGSQSRQGGATQYPPDAYESKPQKAPKAKSPSGGGGNKGGGGGGGAPPSQSGGASAPAPGTG
jgi:penicillin-binding protein 1A